MTVPDIHREVLDNLSDGVLVVGLGGRIETLNPAAEQILGLESGEAQGQTFAELFITREGFDDFTQLLLDATAQRSGVERRVVEVRGGDEARSLSVATSYLRHAGGGPSKAVAVIAVFSDITELRELRETELRMAKAVEEQHRRLQDAYREIETRNEALAAALRKVRVVQGLGAVLAIGLFLGAGFWAWRPLDLFDRPGSAMAADAGPGPGGRRMTVESRPVDSSISLKGTLAPWRTVAVQSPVDGVVAAVRIRVGQEVSQGESLVTMDISRAQAQLRRKRLDFSKALKGVQVLENWERGTEMSAARRSFTKAELELESSRTSINKSRFLFEQGLIAAEELEDQERQHRGQLLDFEAAKDELESVRAQRSEEELEGARLELQATRQELDAMRGQLQGFGGEAGDADVRAPIAGVVLAPRRSGKDLVEGRQVRGGDTLLTIGDFSRLSAVVKADEADITRLGVGQSVTVTGNAFRGLTLRGEVSHVSSQADPKSRGTPKFDVAVTLDPVTPEEAARLRAGMSAKIRIVTYSNPKALLVPIGAVRSRAGTHRLRVVDPDTGEAQERAVEIGPTTRDSVEIRAGLKAGETILAPGRGDG